MSDREPTTEELAAESFRNVQNTARQIAMGDRSDVGAAMIILFDRTGIETTPYVHQKYDSREASLWLLGAMLAHLDDSTPEDMHPLDIADHALALMDEYEDDDRVGRSIQDE